MSTQEIAHQLEHYLDLYAVNNSQEYLTGILTFSAMLAGRCSK